jgi:UPF0755 protein
MTRKRVLMIIAGVLGAGVLGLAGAGGYAWTQLQRTITIPNGKDSVEFAVNARLSIGGAVEKMGTQGLIASPELASVLARVYARWTGKGIQSGIYILHSSMSEMDAVLRLFSAANTETVMVTFQEGITIKRYAAIAAQQVGCSEAAFFRLCYSDSLLKARSIDAPSVEGYLMPNTYEFFKNTSAEEVLNRLLDAQGEFWKTHAEQEKARGLKRHEILSLAAIVEAETPVDAEKKRVAGVYTNRLNIGMKLEADPTVQYALDLTNPNRESRRLLYRDLEVDSKYNTYKYEGLPVGPINSPGRAAIEAALEPERHKFLYFVAAADGSNTHVFSRTADEHLRAVAVYRARRAKLVGR